MFPAALTDVWQDESVPYRRATMQSGIAAGQHAQRTEPPLADDPVRILRDGAVHTADTPVISGTSWEPVIGS